MGKYIDWYAVELEGMLEGRMRPDQIHDFVRQTESHLIDTAEQFQQSGMSEKDSELAAIGRFGRVRKIAEDACHRREPLRRAGEIAMLISFAAFGLFLIWFMFGGPAARQFAFAESTILWSSFIVVCAGAFLARKVMWREILALSTLSFLVIWVFFGNSFAAGTNSTRSALAERVETLEAWIPKIEEEAKLLADKRAEFLRPHSSDKVFSGTGQLLMSVAPTYSYPKHLQGKQITPWDSPVVSVTYGQTQSHDVARQAWAGYGELSTMLLRSKSNMVNRAKESRAKAISSVWESTVDHSPLAFAYALLFAAGGLLVNLVFALLPRLRGNASAMHRRFA